MDFTYDWYNINDDEFLQKTVISEFPLKHIDRGITAVDAFSGYFAVYNDESRILQVYKCNGTLLTERQWKSGSILKLFYMSNFLFCIQSTGAVQVYTFTLGYVKSLSHPEIDAHGVQNAKAQYQRNEILIQTTSNRFLKLNCSNEQLVIKNMAISTTSEINYFTGGGFFIDQSNSLMFMTEDEVKNLNLTFEQPITFVQENIETRNVVVITDQCLDIYNYDRFDITHLKQLRLESTPKNLIWINDDIFLIAYENLSIEFFSLNDLSKTLHSENFLSSDLFNTNIIEVQVIPNGVRLLTCFSQILIHSIPKLLKKIITDRSSPSSLLLENYSQYRVAEQAKEQMSLNSMDKSQFNIAAEASGLVMNTLKKLVQSETLPLAIHDCILQALEVPYGGQLRSELLGAACLGRKFLPILYKNNDSQEISARLKSQYIKAAQILKLYPSFEVHMGIVFTADILQNFTEKLSNLWKLVEITDKEYNLKINLVKHLKPYLHDSALDDVLTSWFLYSLKTKRYSLTELIQKSNNESSTFSFANLARLLIDSETGRRTCSEEDLIAIISEEKNLKKKTAVFLETGLYGEALATSRSHGDEEMILLTLLKMKANLRSGEFEILVNQYRETQQIWESYLEKIGEREELINFLKISDLHDKISELELNADLDVARRSLEQGGREQYAAFVNQQIDLVRKGGGENWKSFIENGVDEAVNLDVSHLSEEQKICYLVKGFYSVTL